MFGKSGDLMSMQEMFYGEREEVWIMKPEKKEETKKGEAPPKPPPPTIQETNFGPLYPHYQKPYSAPAAAPAAKKGPETKNVELKVDICCEGCDELVTLTLTPVKGVKKITCDIPKEKVTVVIANDASADDVLMECRKLRVFRKSRLWTKDD